MIKRLTIYLLISLVFLAFLQIDCSYDYLYAEQFRLFLYTSDYAVLFFPHIGGPIGYLASFILQFFCVPFVGATVTALLFFLTAFGMDELLRRIAPKFPLPFFGIAIGIMQAGVATEMYFSIEQNLSQMLCIWTLVLILSIRKFKYIWIPAALLILFYVTGIYAPVAASIYILVILARKEWKSLHLLTACISLIIMLVGLSTIDDRDFMHVWTMDFYNFSFISCSKHSYWTLGTMYIGVIVAIILSRFTLSRWKLTTVALQIIVAVGISSYYFSRCHLEVALQVKKLEVWRWNEQWDKILNEKMPTNSMPLYANYLNLALAAEGKLGDEFINYGQSGPTGLQLIWQGMQQESDLLSDIFMQEGHVAMAQKMAFTAMQGNRELIHGRLMLRLIETNIILGEYATAERYIKILDHTLFYKDKADAYKKYLYHPELVEKNKRMAELKKCTRGCDWCENDIEKSLKPILKANPSYRNAFEYLGAYYLMSNNLPAFKQFLDDYYTCPGMNPLPASFQKAADYIHWTRPTEK